MSMTLIQRQILTGTQASVTFSNIPQNYQTLHLVISCRRDASTGSAQIQAQLNTTTSGYSDRLISGNGSAAQSSTATTITVGAGQNLSDTANTFSNSTATFANYSGSTNKAITTDWVQENNATTAYIAMHASLWSSTSAITSIALSIIGGGNFISGSTFSIYGIS